MNSPSYLVITAFQAGGVQTSQLDIQDTLAILAGVFALVLFALSVSAWAKRRQPALLLVATAFLLFFVKTIIELLPFFGNVLQSVAVILDFVSLTLFFVAIVLKPRRKKEKQ